MDDLTELVTVEGDEGADEMKRGGPAHIPMGYMFTLNSSNVNDDHPPTKLDAYRFLNLKAGNTKGAPFR